MSDYVLAADLGGTNARVSAVARDGTILASSRGRTPSDGTPEDIAAEVAKLACISCDQAGRRLEPAAFGLSMAALVGSPHGTVISAPNLPQLNGVAFAGLVESSLNIPVVLENDANAAAVGEAWLGASKDVATSICVTLGTGVGGGIILDGRLWRGVDGTAGEIGHICVEHGGHPCGCGSAGCVEQYASATAIVRLTGELLPDFPASILAGRTVETSLEVYEAAGSGDALALEVFRRAGFYLGIALAGLINTLNPEAIVIGGGASAAWEYFIEETRSQVRQKAFRRPAERAKLVRAALGDTAGILGSARLAFDSVPSEPGRPAQTSA